MSNESDPMLESVALDVGGGYDSLWGKTKAVRKEHKVYARSLWALRARLLAGDPLGLFDFILHTLLAM